MREWGRRVRGTAALAVAAGLAMGFAAAGAAAEETPVIELPAAACDVCAPGKPPPPSEVQERVRRINERANWREQRPEGDTIPLGTQTRIWLQRAWASGRLQPGVAGGGSTARPVQPAFRSAAPPSARRNSLAERSRERLSDRRSARDERRGSSSRSRRGKESSRSSSSSRSRDTGSSFGSGLGSDAGSSFGSGGQSGLFGAGGTLGEN